MKVSIIKNVLSSLAIFSLCVLIATPSFAETSQNNASISKKSILLTGDGVYTCGEMAKFYRSNPKSEDKFINWAYGFMSGMNATLEDNKQPTKNLGTINDRDLRTSMRIFCDAHPLQTYYMGVMVYFWKLPNDAK